MHTLATIGFLAVGLIAAAVIFLEVRRKRHYIAYLLRHHPYEGAAAKREMLEGGIAGLVIAAAIVAALVLS